MFDTMTLTKIVGGFCGMLLVFLMGNWVAETVYHVGADGHGDGHGEVKQAYTIPVADGGSSPDPEPVEI